MQMSFSAAHESKALRRTCQSCLARKARFKFRGEVRADRDHTLCFECFRSERDRRRAQMLSDADRARPLAAPSLPPVLSSREIAHRHAMLAHLRNGVTSAAK
jgi:hypothetical protein